MKTRFLTSKIVQLYLRWLPSLREPTNWISFPRPPFVGYTKVGLWCVLKTIFRLVAQMSSLHDGRDGNQGSNLQGSSAGVFELIAAMSNQPECAQPHKGGSGEPHSQIITRYERARRLWKRIYILNCVFFSLWVSYRTALCRTLYWDSVTRAFHLRR